MKLLPIFASICLLVNVAYSQERTAAGALDVQMTWTALKMIADGAKDQAQIATIAANAALDETKKIAACGNKGMFYAPKRTGVDGEGCAVIGGDSRWVISTVNPYSWNKHSWVDASHFAQRGIPTCPRGGYAIQSVRCATKGNSCYTTNMVTVRCGGSEGPGYCDEYRYRLWSCE